MTVKSTRGTAVENINAYDEFGFSPTGDSVDIGFSYDSSLILRGDNLRITGQQIDTVKDSLGANIATTVHNGLVGLFYNSDTLFGIIMRCRWDGSTALTDTAEDAYYQNVTLSIDWSAQ